MCNIVHIYSDSSYARENESMRFHMLDLGSYTIIHAIRYVIILRIVWYHVVFPLSSVTFKFCLLKLVLQVSMND